jgi:hypothetical protein
MEIFSFAADEVATSSGEATHEEDCRHTASCCCWVEMPMVAKRLFLDTLREDDEEARVPVGDDNEQVGKDASCGVAAVARGGKGSHVEEPSTHRVPWLVGWVRLQGSWIL